MRDPKCQDTERVNVSALFVAYLGGGSGHEGLWRV